MNTDTASRLSNTTLVLHWLVGLSIIGLLAVGLYMEENEVGWLYPLHKSFGILVFFLALARIIWRIRNGWPTPAGDHKAIEHMLARAMHWLLIIGTVLMPISGFLMSTLGGHAVGLFGLELVPGNPDPANPDEMLARNKALAGFFHEMHGIAGLIMIGAIALHAAAGLKHHIVDKDGTLRRMLGATLND
jgi:cytochrome b561